MGSSRLRKWITLGFAVGSTALAIALTACGGDGASSSTDISLTFSEWQIAVEPADVGAGEMRFDLDNEGEIPHNLVVVKSDLPPNDLPLTDEAVDKARLNVVGSAGPIAPGPAPEGDAYTLVLTAGKYVLFCDVVVREGGEVESHYRNGMYASFLVEP